MGTVDNSEPDFNSNQSSANGHGELNSISPIPPRKRASDRRVQPESDSDKTESETSPKAGVTLDLEREMERWSKEDHKRFAILKRTMPTTMCLKIIRNATERERRQREEARRKVLVESDQEDEDEENEDEKSQEVCPGHSKTRHREVEELLSWGIQKAKVKMPNEPLRSRNPVTDSSDVGLLDNAFGDDLDEYLSVAPSYSRASTNANATIFTREKPPVRKQLSRVFDRFTISFTILHVVRNIQRARSVISNTTTATPISTHVMHASGHLWHLDCYSVIMA